MGWPGKGFQGDAGAGVSLWGLSCPGQEQWECPLDTFRDSLSFQGLGAVSGRVFKGRHLQPRGAGDTPGTWQGRGQGLALVLGSLLGQRWS